MKQVIIWVIFIFLIWQIIDHRFGFPNSETPHATKRLESSLQPSSLYDSGRRCHLLSRETFLTMKYGSDIDRDDECEHCKKAWKWHFNK